jgi:hypothetical protein
LISFIVSLGSIFLGTFSASSSRIADSLISRSAWTDRYEMVMEEWRQLLNREGISPGLSQPSAERVPSRVQNTVSSQIQRIADHAELF